MLIVKNVSLCQGANVLLQAVNFQVKKGDIVTIMGPSGSGKSSLFSWMVGALSPQLQASGELWLNDKRIDSLPTAQRQIGILFQDALLFDHFSVGQNLLLALPASLKGSARRDEVEHALKRADLAGFFSPRSGVIVRGTALAYRAAARAAGTATGATTGRTVQSPGYVASRHISSVGV